MKIFFKKLNICGMRRVNIYQYTQALLQAGHETVDDARDADTIIVWTCAFRDDYHDNSITVLKEYEKTGKHVVAAGCLPSINPAYIANDFSGDVIHFKNDRDEFKKIFGIDIETAPYPVCEAPLLAPVEEFRAQNPDFKIAWHDQYVKLYISEGCTRKCSYCTEIRAFGPYQSYPLAKIVAAAANMTKKTGIYKLALFGDDVGAWGSDIHDTLYHLIEELLKIDAKVQIALKQINPYHMRKNFDAFKELISSNKIFQLLIPIQSANSRILKLMERDYTRDDLDFLFEYLSKTPAELETHVIAGFPTETAREWQETVDFICRHNFRYVMGNIYMPGQGTIAAEMAGQIDNEEKQHRMLAGSEAMEQSGAVVGHSLNIRGKEHITLKKWEFPLEG